MLRFLPALVAFFGFSTTYAQQFLSAFNNVSALAEINGKACFAADDGQHGYELWISDGTVKGTGLLKDIQPGAMGSDPGNFVVYNGELYFTATTLQYGRELWKTDGTAAGTKLVKDIRAGTGLGSAPAYLIVAQGSLFLTASSDGFNTFLYRSDGSTAGTTEVKLLGFGDVSEIAATTSYLFLTFNDELWRSDGTPAGTLEIDVEGQPLVRNLEPAADKLFFSTSSASGSNVRLYAATGNSNPSALKAFNAPAGSTNYIRNLTEVNGKVFFSVSKDFDTSADELWISDGTTTGTVMVQSFGWSPPDLATAMKDFVSFNNALYFQGGGSVDYSFWKSDGTQAGTSQVSPVQIGYPYQEENKPTRSDNAMYFSGDGELWMSDGSPGGTSELFDINQGQISTPSLVTAIGGKVFFVANDGYGISLWVDTPAGEVDIKSGRSLVSGEKFYFDPVQVDGCAVKTLEIVNAGKRELILSEVNVAGQDYFIQGTLPELLNPGERHSIDVYFLPLAAGARPGRLTIKTNDENEGNFTLNLTGESVEGDTPAFCDVYSASLTKQLRPGSDPDVVISKNSVQEKLPAGTVVGQVSVAGSTGIYSYTLVDGVGAADNGLFQLSGGVLKTVATFDYKTRTVYTVRVRADGDAGQYESAITINVTRSPNPMANGDCEGEIRRLNFGIYDIAFNSQGHLFAAGENGSLMRSTNDGSTWTRLESGVRYPLREIEFRGSSGYVIGEGVLLKSDDNGATWSRLWLPDDVVVQSAFFVNENAGYAAGINGELLYTPDGGKHWESRGVPFFIPPSAFWFWDDNNGIACDDLGNVIKTNDGGLSWYAVDISLIGDFNEYKDIAFADVNTGLLISSTDLYKTDDGGESWYPVSGITGENFTRVAFTGGSTAYVVGGFYTNEVWMTINGGVSWSQVAADPLTGVTGIAHKASSNLVVLSGDNSSNPGSIEPGNAFIGATAGSIGWTIKSELRSQDFYAVQFPSENVGYAFGEFFSYKTTDGGLSWKKLDLSQAITGAQFTDEQKGFVADGYNIYKTTNGGRSFAPVFNVDVNGSATLRKLLAISSDVVLAYSTSGTIYRTGNGGTSWPVVYDEALNQLMEITFAGSQVGYGVDLLGKVIKTSDGGASWSTVYTWSGAGEFFNTIDFVSPTVGFIGGKDGLLLKTTNGGTSWTPVFGGIPSTITQLVFASASEGYAFLEEGTVYKTTDGGTTWSALGNLPYIGLSAVDVAGDKIYYCGNYGNLGKIDERPKPTRPGYVSGPEQICAGDKVTFEVAGDSDLEYLWTVSGGSLSVEGNSAVVDFENAGDYVITVSTLSSCGTSSSRTLNVSVSGPPAPAIAGLTFVPANSEQEYVIESANENSRYTWNVAGAVSYSQDGEVLNVTWASDPGIVKVMEIDEQSGCRAAVELAVEVDESTVVGIPDVSVLDAGVSVFPNPTPDYLYIESSLANEVQLRVYDLSGKDYGRQWVNPNSRELINLTSLPPGLYLIEISAKGLKEKSVLRIVKE